MGLACTQSFCSVHHFLSQLPAAGCPMEGGGLEQGLHVAQHQETCCPENTVSLFPWRWVVAALSGRVAAWSIPVLLLNSSASLLLWSLLPVWVPDEVTRNVYVFVKNANDNSDHDKFVL